MICPTCGLPMWDDETRPYPNCNPLRSPECWRVTDRLTKQGRKPLARDGRADLSQAGAHGEPA